MYAFVGDPYGFFPEGEATGYRFTNGEAPESRKRTESGRHYTAALLPRRIHSNGVWIFMTLLAHFNARLFKTITANLKFS